MPKGVPHKFDETKRKAFIGAYEVLKASCGKDETILFIDPAFVLNIELHNLPSYSPNLNLIDRLWKVMNEYLRNNFYFKTKREF